MEAPKKLYIHRTPHLGLLAASEMNITGEDIEYTRSDAFIEKAVKFMCNCIEDEMARHLETWHPDMKAKTVERFKNYMKGE